MNKYIDKQTGAVVEQGDIEGLVSAVARLVKSDYTEMLYSMHNYRGIYVARLVKSDYTEMCRQKALQEFDNTKCFNPYVALYNKLLGGVKP